MIVSHQQQFNTIGHQRPQAVGHNFPICSGDDPVFIIGDRQHDFNLFCCFLPVRRCDRNHHCRYQDLLPLPRLLHIT
jgi:hypothetical protein